MPIEGQIVEEMKGNSAEIWRFDYAMSTSKLLPAFVFLDCILIQTIDTLQIVLQNVGHGV